MQEHESNKETEMLHVGVVGLGAIGQEHLDIYGNMPEVVLSGVADLNESLAGEVARRIGTQAYASAAELLEDPTVDAISLCTPDHLHYADAKRIIAAGKHLLLEKPIATTVAEADQLVELAEASGLAVMPGHTLRFENHYVAARALVSAGRIGDIVHGYVRRNNKISVAERVRGECHALPLDPPLSGEHPTSPRRAWRDTGPRRA